MKSLLLVQSRVAQLVREGDRPPKKAITNGADHHLGVSGDTVVAKPFHWQFSHFKDCLITEDQTVSFTW